MASPAITEPRRTLGATSIGRPGGSSLVRGGAWLLLVAVLAAVTLEGLVASSLGPAAGDLLRIGRNAAYLVLAPFLLGYVVLTGRIRAFLQPVDIALAVLVAVMFIGSLAADSSIRLTGEGMFVYLRGTIIFYAIRALRPSWADARRLAWLLGGIFVVNAIVAVIQGFVGLPAFTFFGFTDLTWAVINRAQGLQVHPNHLGHILGLGSMVVLGLIASKPRVPARWWALFALFAYAIAASQSRETVLGMVAGLIVLLILRRSAIKRLVAAGTVLVAFVAVIWIAHPANFAELTRRLTGVVTAIEIPSGQEEGVVCDPSVEPCTIEGVPHREVRVLYIQQGLALWTRQPVFGYGIGQFGGAVAFEDDPRWYLDPRFGPNGFSMHGFEAKQVDSFWLHLFVEVGAAGSIAYAIWYLLLGWPLARWSWPRRRSALADGATDLALSLQPAAVAALAFAWVVAVFSPSLEDPMFPPLLFALLGFAWLTRPADTSERPMDPAPGPA